MKDSIKVVCENDSRTHTVTMGTTLLDIASECKPHGAHPFLAAYVNHRIKELSYKVYTPVDVRFIDITESEGHRVYQRTAVFMLQKAVGDLFPGRTFYVRHSLGSGLYCEIEGMPELSAAETSDIRRRMCEIAAADYPIRRSRRPTDEIRETYRKYGFDDKIALLDSRPRLYSDLYTMDDAVGYFYGALTPSTGYIDRFDIRPYYNGLYLILPDRADTSTLRDNVHADKMLDVFRGYKQWVDIMGVPTVGRLNEKILSGDGSELIKIAEALHEKQLAAIADSIADANASRGMRLVLISGPSSSGKTTFAKRLGIQLRILGMNPVLISLDDYFVDREKTPLDENGDYDYEALEAIDLDLFNDHLRRLAAGESVSIPRYDFISGTSLKDCTPLTLDERSILVIEGIHGLNPRLTPGIPDDLKFKIYISCFTTVAMDNISRIPTTDNRLLRRLIRDYRTRGSDAVKTLARWPSVRRGEQKHIFPYQENADVMFNSSLFYEISAMRRFAEPILREVPDTEEVYSEASRMLKFLDNFIPIDIDEVPPTSLLREFVGGSSFKY